MYYDGVSPTGPFLSAYFFYSPSPATTISCSGTSNIQFDVLIAQVGTYTSILMQSISINSVYYTHDYLKPHTLIFSRYDPVTNGYIIGSVDYYLTDLGGASHHLIASFKLRRR